MNKGKQNNRPLIFSIITLIICIALLIGATLAWFTDTETNTGNTIQAGTLDVELWVWLPTDSADAPSTTTVNSENGWTQITNESGTNAIFGDLFNNWAPGDEESIYLAVVNKGSLALDYTIDLVITEDELADALQFKSEMSTGSIPSSYTNDYVTISSQIDDDDVISATGTTSNNLDDGTIDFTMMSIKLDESTERTYQGEEFVMDLILIASQQNLVQNDDTAIVKAYTVADINGAATDSTVILMQDITDASQGVDLDTNVNFDLNGYTLTVKSFTMTNTTDYCTVDIAGGSIIATSGDVTINIPKGTLNLENQDTFVTDGNELNITASPNTVNYSGAVGVYKITAEKVKDIASGETTVEDVKEDAPTGDAVINGNINVIINEDAVVTANIKSADETDGTGYVFANNGTLNGVATGATNEEGTLAITSAQQLYDFLTSGTEEYAVLANNITYDTDTDTYGVMDVSSTKDLDLSGYTITIPNDVTNKNRPINLLSNSDFTIHGGYFICGTLEDGDTSKANGSYGAIESKSGVSNVILNIYDMEFSNTHYYALCVRIYSGTTAMITNSVFYSAIGGAINTSSYAVANVYDNTIITSNYNDYNTSAVAAMNSGVINVYSGTYSGEGYGAYVFSSGGTINIHGGDWSAETYVLKSDSGYSSAVSIINVYDGTFDGKIGVTQSSGSATINIYGGTFSNTGLTLIEFSAYVPTGYTATETSTGVYTVTAAD